MWGNISAIHITKTENPCNESWITHVFDNSISLQCSSTKFLVNVAESIIVFNCSVVTKGILTFWHYKPNSWFLETGLSLSPCTCSCADPSARQASSAASDQLPGSARSRVQTKVYMHDRLLRDTKLFTLCLYPNRWQLRTVLAKLSQQLKSNSSNV